MKKLYEARDRIEAQMLRDYLADHHIESVVLGDYLSGAAGDLPAIQFPAVWVVEADDYPRGRQLIKQFHTLGRDVEDAWHCPECGETVDPQFNICWNCGKPKA
ncbi:MAG: DUF2007 domain-containing protein [Candidatus Sedimenticola sp. PURPLELP]